MNRIEMIKRAVDKAEIRKCITNVAARKRALKAEIKLHKKLTKASRNPDTLTDRNLRNLDSFADETLYYSKHETQNYLDGSSMMETYEAMKTQDDY